MRYAIYWYPEKKSEIYQFSCDWFEQTSKFQLIIEDYKNKLTYHDFLSAFRIPQKYGFHAELYPPFKLKLSFSEQDIFDDCRAIAKNTPQCDLRLSVASSINYCFLKSKYKSNVILNLQENLYQSLSKITEDCSYVTEDSVNEKDFQLILSHSINKKMNEDILLIANQFWDQLLRTTVEIKHFNLCYQKEKNTSFQEIMRFDFK